MKINKEVIRKNHIWVQASHPFKSHSLVAVIFPYLEQAK